MATSIDVVSNVLKIVRQEIGEIVRYSHDRKKKQNFGSLSNCRYCMDRAQNLAHNVADFIQIGSLSAEL